MKRFPNTALALLFASAVAVAALQGARVSRLREAEMFYRWILAEATQLRMFPESAEDDSSVAEDKRLMDGPLMDAIGDAAESALDGVAPVAGVDANGAPVRKFVAIAGDTAHDRRIWDLARGDVLAAQRADFLRYLREKRLLSVESTFDPKDNYSGTGAGVNLGNIFFGFRQIAANFVWLQVDRYWHQGAMHRMIPLMKTCVTLDPHFVDAYQLGAWHLAFNATAKMMDTPEPLKEYSEKYQAWIGPKEIYYYMAIEFLRDGIKKNPRNYKLYFDLGFEIYKLKLKDYGNAVRYLSEAIRYRHDRWVPRQLYICLELDGQYEKAKAGWEDWLRRNIGNQIAEETATRFISRNEGLIAEKKAEELTAQASAETDPAKGEALRAQAEQARVDALKAYESIRDADGNVDSFAVGRIKRMQAVRYLEQDRYLEAIALLENARWQSNELFEEASEMIIAAKQQAGIPLSVSEDKAVKRRQDAEHALEIRKQDAAARP